MIAVVDDTNTLIYVGETIELLPASLLEQDLWGNKSVYRHIQVRERPIGKMLVWNDKLEIFEEALKPSLSLEPAQVGITDDALMKENEALKQRVIEQERQMNLIRQHLGL